MIRKTLGTETRQRRLFGSTIAFAALIWTSSIPAQDDLGPTTHYFRTQAFQRGDFNQDSTVDLSDASAIFNWLFLGGPGTSCLNAGDTNHDVQIDLSDGAFLLNWLFLGGPEPVAPGPLECGVDPSDRQLSCESYDPCPDELPLIHHVLNRITYGPTEELLTQIQTREQLIEYIEEQLDAPDDYDQETHEPEIAEFLEQFEIGYNPDGLSAQGQNVRLKAMLFVDAVRSRWQLLHKLAVFHNNHFHTQFLALRNNVFGRGPVGGGAARTTREQFDAADADSSGGITEEEWIAFREEHPGVLEWSAFQRNNNADGNLELLTPEEYLSIPVISYWKYWNGRQQFGISAEMELREYRAFRRHALGSFRDLGEMHAKSVAQVIYLNNYENTVIAPNENYGREFFELFFLGVDHIYTQRDIEEVSKVFTGWRLGWHRRDVYDEDDILRISQPGAEHFNIGLREPAPFRFALPTFWDDDTYEWGFHFGNPVRGSVDGHDWGRKDLFLPRYGGVDSLGNPVPPSAAVRIAENTRNHTVHAAMAEFDRVFDQTLAFRDCAKYISSKLIQLFVTDDLSRLAKTYEMPEDLAALFDAADGDGDGVIERSEWDEPTPDLPNGKPPGIFESLDANSNGRITRREYQEPDLLLDAIAAWQESDGDIREVVRAILLSDEFLSLKFFRAKVKDPFELFTSTIRALRAETEPQQVIAAISDLQFAGMEMFDFADPTGESEFGFDWMHTVGLLERLKYVNRVAAPLRGQNRANWSPTEVRTRWDLEDSASAVEFYTLLLHAGDILENQRELAQEAYQSTLNQDLRLRRAVAYLLSLPQFQKQ